MDNSTWTALLPDCICTVQQDGFAAIFNTAASTRNVLLRAIKISVLSEVRAFDTSNILFTSLIAPVALRRITGHTVGSTTIAPVPTDTGAPPLPAQVVCALKPVSVVTANGTLRQNLLLPGLPQQIANTNSSAAYGPPLAVRIHNSAQQNSFFAGRPGSASTPLVVREGEGVALVSTASMTGQIQSIDVTVRDRASGYLYVYHQTAAGFLMSPVGYALLSFFNGVGSGRVYEVVEFNVTDCSENMHSANIINESTGCGPYLFSGRVAVIEGYEGGTITPPAAHDSAGSASGIEVVSGPLLPRLQGERQGIVFDRWSSVAQNTWSYIDQSMVSSIGNRILVSPPQGPNAAVFIPPPFRCRDYIMDFTRSTYPLVLPPGSGVVVMEGRPRITPTGYRAIAPAQAVLDVEFRYGLTAAPASSSNLTSPTFGWG